MTSLAKLPLRDDELAIVISNLLDNAIEACARYDGLRIIHLKAKIHEGQLVLMVTNPSQNPPQKVNEQWVTSKSDSSLHGFGLCSIENILNSFNAEYASEYADGIFSYVAFIPFNKN